jgi:Zn-dependent protease
MFPELPTHGLALVIALLVLSLVLHEVAHGWVAYRFGDTTARDQGRLTLNPLAHIDPFMTILLPVVLYLTVGFIFGGAKPVPVNFHNLRKPYPHMALVALAGPATNFLLAVLGFLVLKVMVVELGLWEMSMLGPKVLLASIFFNLLLAAFNLLPVPPLDGSRIMAWLLPQGLRAPYARLERFGLILVFVLIMLPGFHGFLGSTMEVLYDAVRGIVSLGGLW